MVRPVRRQYCATLRPRLLACTRAGPRHAGSLSTCRGKYLEYVRKYLL